ncbi:MAG: hypothetical protein ACLSD6_02075 [Clostridium sp.]
MTVKDAPIRKCRIHHRREKHANHSDATGLLMVVGGSGDLEGRQW